MRRCWPARPGVPVVDTGRGRGAGTVRAGRAAAVGVGAPITIGAFPIWWRDISRNAGFVLDRCATFDLDGDLQMNRLSGAAINGGGRARTLQCRTRRRAFHIMHGPTAHGGSGGRSGGGAWACLLSPPTRPRSGAGLTAAGLP